MISGILYLNVYRYHMIYIYRSYVYHLCIIYVSLNTMREYHIYLNGIQWEILDHHGDSTNLKLYQLI